MMMHIFQSMTTLAVSKIIPFCTTRLFLLVPFFFEKKKHACFRTFILTPVTISKTTAKVGRLF